MGPPRRLLSAFWLFAGAMHFIRPRAYQATVPDYVPISAADAVSWSGAAEIAGGLLVAPAATRRIGRWWLTGLLLAVFPANVQMAVAPEQVAARGVPIDRLPRWLLIARLPVQALFLIWAWRATE